jgi:hypothetical protein
VESVCWPKLIADRVQVARFFTGMDRFFTGME